MTRGTVNIKFTTFTSFISFPMEIVRLSYPYQNFTEVKIGQNIKNYLKNMTSLNQNYQLSRNICDTDCVYQVPLHLPNNVISLIMVICRNGIQMFIVQGKVIHM